MNNNELKIMVPNGWVVSEEVMSAGSRMLVIKPDTATADDTAFNKWEGIFKKVHASELRLDDAFMKHQPKTEAEKRFKERVQKVIKAGLRDFWRPVCDPSFDGNGGICFEPGKKPAVGKSYNWWAKAAKEFKPEQGSRLGTKNEYIAFLAVLIKELVNSGKSVEWAWNAVCNDSKELGHYWNSKNAKHAFENTGSREICGFFDLANTYKILAEDEEAGGFWLASGNYVSNDNLSPLADLFHDDGRNSGNKRSCGWLVLTEGSTDN